MGSGLCQISDVYKRQEFTFASNWNLGSGMSLVLMVFILISMAAFARYDKDGEGAAF